MILRLRSGLRISIPPVFPWEAAKTDVIIRCKSVFHPFHLTSRLCLGFLDRYIGSVQCRSLLDVGCGSGILAIAAAARGVPLVIGLDIDMRAINASMDNARKNRLVVSPHWILGKVDALRADFDCVVANLPFDILVETAADLKRLLRPGGHLILSGFHDIHFHWVQQNILSEAMHLEEWSSGDVSFNAVPPSGSYTWLAIVVKALSQAPHHFRTTQESAVEYRTDGLSTPLS